ncbi:MAG TPA: hypothetical protein HPP87_09985 [Planctomycetes bacterium]|nr:hypothetical protein [Planctomycetota bacterium]
MEDLRDCGYNMDPIDWPEGAVSAYRETPFSRWEFVLRSDVLKRKREKMERCLWWKREYGTTKIRALYVWVFWCPGVSGFYKGWWSYLVGIGRDYHGGGLKRQLSEKLFRRAMELYPIDGQHDIWPDRSKWMRWFARRYQQGVWCGKAQGKAAVWCEVRGDHVNRIISRAEWPCGKEGARQWQKRNY